MARQALFILSLVAAPGLAETFSVGDGQPYAAVSDVPWESISAGDTVLIHWRPAAYHEKWVIAAQGTPRAPITVRGVPGSDGTLPVIDGDNAITRLELDYWNENRSVIKVGGSSQPPNVLPTHVVIENLDIRGARPPHSFTDDSGNSASYASNAAAIHIERGVNVTVRNCVLRDSGNGLFVSSGNAEAAGEILIEGNWLYGNGNVGSAFHHNAYTAALGIIYQFNRFGPLQPGAHGNNLKDRSGGLVVRYNWIEGGNRQLDLVDAEDSSLIQQDPLYHTTQVFGNLLIEPDGAGNSQIVHYGGDSGAIDSYRKGTLHFYHNTVVSTRSGNTTLFRLSTNDEHCDARNNVFYVTASGDRLAILNQDGVIDLSHNWHKPGWVDSHGVLDGVINDDGTSITSNDPGFVDAQAQDYSLAEESACVDASSTVHPDTQPPEAQYGVHRRQAIRTLIGQARDVGAFEQRRPQDLNGDGVVEASDLAALLGKWGLCPLPPGWCEPDLNQDQMVTAADLAIVLSAWD